MARLLYSATMSLDGFIAGPDGDMSWLTRHLGPNPEVDDLIGRIGALLVGRRTFGGDDPHRGTEKEGKAFGGGWYGPQFVLTHDAPDVVIPDTTFVGDLGRAVKAAREAAGDKYVNVLGADVARQCLEAGELDEILMIVAPVLLGDGTPMFDRPDGRSVDLEQTHVTTYPHATNLWYRVRR